MDLFMTDTEKMADMVLPACSSLDMTGLAYNYGLTGGMPFVMLSPKIISPVGECWPDWKFYTELGRRMGYGEHFPWNTDEEVCEHFLKASPVILQQLRDTPRGGIWYGERCYNIEAKGQIRTPSKKIELYSQTLADAGYDPHPGPQRTDTKQGPVSGTRRRLSTHPQHRRQDSRVHSLAVEEYP